jgi:carboxylesterase
VSSPAAQSDLLSRRLDLRDFRLRLSGRLLLWALPSAAVGLALILVGSGFWQGFGIQAAAWGSIDAAIALLGRRAAVRSARGRQGAAGSESARTEGRRLRRILWINTALDVLYVAAGLALALTLGRRSVVALGHGAGVVLQGAFLLLFDLIHAQAVPPAPPSRSFRPFLDPRHLSFRLAGGAPGAVLVHGFPGTPAEMRPLAETLHGAGWTVHAPLLPGFGAEFPGLMEMRHEQWQQAVERAVEKLRREHDPVLLAGYSLGGALAIAAARRTRPDGLLLLAPFWSLGSPLQRAFGGTLRPFLPQYLRLFKDADFEDPAAGSSIQEFFPDADPKDPELQRELRELAVPLSLLGELARAGLRAYREAPRVDTPVSIIQGTRDALARAELTRRLSTRFPGRPTVLELPAGHRLLDSGASWWEALREAVADFAAGLSSASGEGSRRGGFRAVARFDGGRLGD